ncbi:hypothetical protein ACQ4LK_23175, partial [Bacillus pumilus]
KRQMCIRDRSLSYLSAHTSDGISTVPYKTIVLALTCCAPLHSGINGRLLLGSKGQILSLIHILRAHETL